MGSGLHQSESRFYRIKTHSHDRDPATAIDPAIDEFGLLDGELTAGLLHFDGNGAA